MLEGEEAVKEGLIDEVGGIREALDRLYTLIERKKHRNNQFCMWLLMILVA